MGFFLDSALLCPPIIVLSIHTFPGLAGIGTVLGTGLPQPQNSLTGTLLQHRPPASGTSEVSPLRTDGTYPSPLPPPIHAPPLPPLPQQPLPPTENFSLMPPWTLPISNTIQSLGLTSPSPQSSFYALLTFKLVPSTRHSYASSLGLFLRGFLQMSTPQPHSRPLWNATSFDYVTPRGRAPAALFFRLSRGYAPWTRRKLPSPL